MIFKELKTKLYEKCHDIVHQKLTEINQMRNELQESVNKETKSSAGDKHETGRAMAQIEIDNLSKQIVSFEQQLAALSRLDTQQKFERICFGSLVRTNAGLFFISIGLGKVEADGKSVFAISPESPIAKEMKGLSKNESFTINGIKQQIVEVS